MTTKFVTGLAKGAAGYDVGKEAAKKALQKLGDSKVHLSIVFASPRYDYQEVLRGVREITDNAPLIGCSSAGEFTEEEAQNESVACALISSDTHKFFTGIGEGLRKDEMKCVNDATKNFPSSVKGYPYLSYVLCADGLVGRGEEIALAMFGVLGMNMKFAGGNAGDDLRMVKTEVFADKKSLSDAISLALIASKKPLVIAVQHGHMPISPLLTITKSKAGVVYEIDGKPAFEIWKKYAGEEARKSLGIDVNKLQDHTKDLTRFLTYYEAGLCEPSFCTIGGIDYKVRWPGLTITTSGAMKFGDSMPEGTVIRVMSSSKEKQIISARRSAEMVIDALRGVKLAGVVVFDCFVRGIILQDEFYKAVNAVKEVLKVPIIGFEAYGEFAMELGQVSGHHDTTTVILAIPD